MKKTMMRITLIGILLTAFLPLCAQEKKIDCYYNDFKDKMTNLKNRMNREQKKLCSMIEKEECNTSIREKRKSIKEIGKSMKNELTKALALLLALASVFTLAAAAAPAEEAAAPAEEKIVIKFAAQGDSTPATQKSIDNFNASQDKYVVEWADMSNDSGAMKDALKTSLSAGSSDYDVISMDVCWAGEFAAAGYITPIDEMLKNAGLKLLLYTTLLVSNNSIKIVSSSSKLGVSSS